MTDNPFDDPGDHDRTIIRPQPGGVLSPKRPSRVAPPPAVIELVPTGDGPLAVAAAPLLQLLGRLRDASAAPDPGDVRERTRRELRAFERRAQVAGIPADQMRLAHYALCASLDDVVLNTPWGSQGRWRDAPLAEALHQDPHGGAGFFDQLRAMRDGLPATLPLLQLMYLCLSLGMAGPYRATAEGLQQVQRIRHQVFGLIAGADQPGALSPAIPGRKLPKPPRARLPVWVAAALAIGAVGAVFVACLTSLNEASDALYKQAVAAQPRRMPELVRPPETPPPLPPPPAPDAGSRIQLALADLRGVDVLASPATITVRIAATQLFPRGNAVLAAGKLIDDVAHAVSAEPGPIRVVAYTDARTPSTVAFPSKFALTQAWAAAVRAALARDIPALARSTAEGRADSNPVAPSSTAPERERNRRIEIVLTRPLG